ncbi:MAG: DUF2520 domain-containing protein [bacterium]|nr:DUF2520 domain-containing protein [bacterium]
MDHPEFAIVGPGRIGLNLLSRLRSAGWRCVAIRGHRAPPSDLCSELKGDSIWDTWSQPEIWTCPQVVFVSVPDAALPAVDRDLSNSLTVAGATVLHTSGLNPSSLLADCQRAGAAVGSWHPLQSFPPLSLQKAEWKGIPCAIEGDAAALEIGFAAARAVGAEPWQINPEEKAAYHAAAVVAANLSHILVAEASHIMSSCGAWPKGVNPLRHVVTTSTQAALEAPDLSRLTGPISRNDVETIDHHLRILPTALAEVYNSLVLIAKKRLANT